MQKLLLRPMMTGCILYLVMLAALFLLSDFFVLQIILTLLPISGLALCMLPRIGNMLRLPALLRSRRFCVGAMIPILLAAFGVFSVMHDYRMLCVQGETTRSVVGVVERVYYATDSGASFLLDLKTVDGKRNGGRLRVDGSGQSKYANKGEIVSCTVTLGTEDLLADYSENIGYAFPDGIYAYAAVSDTITVQGAAWSFAGICDAVADVCRQRLYRYLPEDAAELCISILLGDTSVLSAELKRDFRRVGISHVLAVSGMHLSILISGLLFTMRRIGIGFRRRYVIVLMFIVLYMGITGCSPSVMRAGFMWMLSCIAQLLYTRADAPTSLFTAAAALCVLSPYAIFDVGLILSVSATLGLIVLMPAVSRLLYGTPLLRRPLLKPFRYVLNLTAATLSATVFTLPMTLFVFGELSLAAPLANLLIHFPVTVMMYCAPLLLLLSFAEQILPLGWLTGFLAGVLSGDTALISDLAGWMSHMPNAIIGVRYVFTAVLLLVCLGLVLGLCIRFRSVLPVFPVYGVFLAALFAAVQIHAYSVRGDVAITYSVNGKNDNIAVVTDGRGMLIDASDGSRRNTDLAWDMLSAQNITELHVCVLTHYHTRHASTLTKLAQNVVVESLVLPIPLTEDEMQICKTLQTIAEHAGINVQMYRRGEDDIVFGEAVVSVFPRTLLSRSVQPVLGWTISAHDEDVVYLGGAAFETVGDDDFSSRREAALARGEILLLGIHGPLYKSAIPSDRFSSSVRAVIAANDEVRAWLAGTSADVPIYTAASDGAVRIILDS